MKEDFIKQASRGKGEGEGAVIWGFLIVCFLLVNILLGIFGII